MPKRKSADASVGKEKKKETPEKKPRKTASKSSAGEEGESTEGVATREGCNFTIASWNVAGMRAWCKKEGFKFITEKMPDVVCLQETKCSEDNCPKEMTRIHGYEQIWLCGLQEGYAGVGVLTKQKPLKTVFGLGEPKFDAAGRVITLEYEQFYLVNVYVPNSGRGLVNLTARLEWDVVFRNYLKKLDESKPVIAAGDFNVSHLEIDIANPKSNKRNAGFTQEERDGFSELLDAGFADTFREFYPKKPGVYSFWSFMRNARAKNIGWRLDYFVVSKRFMGSVCDSKILTNVTGSDHCPILLELKL